MLISIPIWASLHLIFSSPHISFPAVSLPVDDFWAHPVGGASDRLDSSPRHADGLDPFACSKVSQLHVPRGISQNVSTWRKKTMFSPVEESPEGSPWSETETLAGGGSHECGWLLQGGDEEPVTGGLNHLRKERSSVLRWTGVVFCFGFLKPRERVSFFNITFFFIMPKLWRQLWKKPPQT